MHEDFASIYLHGSILVGAILLIVGALILRNGGVLHPDPSGKALGWTACFIVIESGWIGVSVVAFFPGSLGLYFVGPTVSTLYPPLYLFFAACVLVAGALRRPMSVAVMTKVLTYSLLLQCLLALVSGSVFALMHQEDPTSLWIFGAFYLLFTSLFVGSATFVLGVLSSIASSQGRWLGLSAAAMFVAFCSSCFFLAIALSPLRQGWPVR